MDFRAIPMFSACRLLLRVSGIGLAVLLLSATAGGTADVQNVPAEPRQKAEVHAAAEAPDAEVSLPAGVHRRYVGKKVSEFPEKLDMVFGGLDMSKPESTVANWNRAWATKDAAALVELSSKELWGGSVQGGSRPPDVAGWTRILEDYWQHRDPAHAEALLSAQIVEVLTYRDKLAGVISYVSAPEAEAEAPYSLRVVCLIDGKWKNLGEGGYPSLDAARGRFGKRKDFSWTWYCWGVQPFGRVIEQVLHEGDKDSGIDFDTGKLISRAADWPADFQGRMARLREAGVDAVADEVSAVRGLVGIDLIVVPVAAKGIWDSARPAGLAPNRVFPGKAAAPTVPISAAQGFPRTFAIRTREGGVGLLQILGFAEDGKGVRIRYKMVQGAGAPMESAGQ